MNKGIIQVKINNHWGYICKDELWNKANAKVVCRQLGFSRYGNIEMYHI